MLSTVTSFRSLRPALALLAAFVLAGLAAAPAAYAQKVGFVNQEALLTNMPEYAESSRQMREEMRAQQEELMSEQQAFQERLERYQKQRPLLSDSSRAEREEELRRMQQELQLSAQEREQMMARREFEMLQPLVEKLNTAIEAVAQENSLDVVMRADALVYVSDDVMNISEAVARKLGIDIGEAARSAPEASVNPMSNGNN
jgi:outer membrane protein